MRREELKKALQNEIDRWERKQYADVMSLPYPVVYEVGKRGEPGYYSTEVCLLEHEAAYVHLSVSVDDGGFSVLVPVSGSAMIRTR